jgi:hypothetical protein
MTAVEAPGSLHLSSPTSAGPVIRRYRIRTFLIWAVLAALGLLPTLLRAPAGWQAAGLGMWFPGAGFLSGSLWWATVLTLVLFPVSMALWVLCGGFIFPILVWLGSAGLSSLTVGEQSWRPAGVIVPLITAAVFATAAGYFALDRRQASRKAATVATQLAHIEFVAPDAKCPPVGELSAEDLREMRYLVDLVLQPIDRFDGFNTIDQFREAAYRYPLVSINHALAALQVNYAPAFDGYLRQAQQNAIIKMTDRRVWHYWRVENFLGNLKLGADPIRSENIMYSGWWALALGAYERATGDCQFSAPGALTLIDKPGRSYVYDYSSIVQAVTRQFDETSLCFFPCEPNWSFAVCNLYGMGGALLFDRQHNTRYGLNGLDRFNNVLETEFSRGDGRSALIVSRRTGLALVTNTASNLQTIAWLTNMVSPRLAQVSWALLRQQYLASTGGDLQRLAPGSPMDLLDAGNYRMTGAFYWASMMAGAREMGDEEIYRIAAEYFAALAAAANGEPPERARSVFAVATALVGSFGTKDTWYRFAHGDVPAPTRTGPRLEKAPYPAVLVASATNDGRALKLVLRSGDGRPTEHELGFRGLEPLREYRLQASDGENPVLADASGRATGLVRIADRTEIALTPKY